ncbi:ErmCL family antibiotic resistance leader peptide [Staphylococcus aureus]
MFVISTVHYQPNKK